MNRAPLQSHPADHVDGERPVTETEAAEHIAATAFRTGEPERVGAEVAWLVTAEGGRRLHPERLRSLLLAKHALPKRTALGFEPGGALALSAGPHASLRECFDALESDRRRAAAALDTIGAGLLGLGLDPVRPPHRLLRSQRYQAMEQLFDQDGRAGRWMMANTASVQICLDAGTDGNGHRGLRDRWALAHWLAPVLLAAFANSPFIRGKAGLWRSARQHVWSAVDRTRTGPAPVADPRRSWARYALDARVMAVRGAGHWLVPERLTFREWIRTASPRPATLADLEYHLTTLFPPVRPRGRHLELRMVDAQPGRDWIVPVAVASALLEDPRANDAAWAAVERLWSDGARPAELYARAAAAALHNAPLAEAARTCLAAAREALARGGADAEIVALVDDFAERHTARALTPADVLLRMHPGGRWR